MLITLMAERVKWLFLSKGHQNVEGTGHDVASLIKVICNSNQHTCLNSLSVLTLRIQ